MSVRESIVLGGGTTLGGGAPLFPDAIRLGDLLLLSGRAAIDPASGSPRVDDFTAQAHIVIDDVATVLSESRSSLADVLRVECWLTDQAHFASWNEIFAARFPQPRPARTTTVSGLPLPGLLIELQVTAVMRS